MLASGQPRAAKLSKPLSESLRAFRICSGCQIVRDSQIVRSMLFSRAPAFPAKLASMTILGSTFEFPGPRIFPSPNPGKSIAPLSP